MQMLISSLIFKPAFNPDYLRFEIKFHAQQILHFNFIGLQSSNWLLLALNHLVAVAHIVIGVWGQVVVAVDSRLV